MFLLSPGKGKIASANQKKKQEQFKERLFFFIANFQRELTNFLYYDRISILRIGPIDNVKAEEVLSALCACWILNMNNCWASVCSMVSGQVSSDWSLLFKLHLGHDPSSWLQWMSRFKVVITMHVITKEFGRAKKNTNPVYSIEYFGRFEAQLSKEHMKNKSMVIDTKNNFNITIWMRENAIWLCQRKKSLHF